MHHAGCTEPQPQLDTLCLVTCAATAHVVGHAGYAPAKQLPPWKIASHAPAAVQPLLQQHTATAAAAMGYPACVAGIPRDMLGLQLQSCWQYPDVLLSATAELLSSTWPCLYKAPVCC
jgi:hypothetical protein